MSYNFPFPSARVSSVGSERPSHILSLSIRTTFEIVDVLAGKVLKIDSAGVVTGVKCLPSTSTCNCDAFSMTVCVSLCSGGSDLLDSILWYFASPSSYCSNHPLGRAGTYRHRICCCSAIIFYVYQVFSIYLPLLFFSS